LLEAIGKYKNPGEELGVKIKNFLGALKEGYGLSAAQFGDDLSKDAQQKLLQLYGFN
jgi:hypothetical protein